MLKDLKHRIKIRSNIRAEFIANKICLKSVSHCHFLLFLSYYAHIFMFFPKFPFPFLFT